MATTYKSLSTNDIVTTKTLLHEAIPITGTIASGSYNTGSPATEQNIKNYTHGQFQSVYDYPYLSSSANHIFDISVGSHATSDIHSASGSPRTGLTEGSKKINMYNQMAQVLMGYDENGAIRLFDQDGDLTNAGTVKDYIFINFARLLTKDEIKKGSFSMEFGVNETFSSGTAGSGEGSGDSFRTAGQNTYNRILKVHDVNAQNDYRVNSPAGDYGILYSSASVPADILRGSVANNVDKVGLIFYQAGVAIIDPGIFHDDAGLTASPLQHGFLKNDSAKFDLHMNSASKLIDQMFVSSSVKDICDSIRHRVYNISFNNTTELNSTVYFCRAHHNEFNYSTNPTYLNNSQIFIKNEHSDSPISYITTVGLYSADNELLAVAKLSEPLRKDPTNELTLRVRLDY